MKIGKIQSKVLAEALKSKKFFSLSCYLSCFMRDGECFISSWNDFNEMWNLKAAIEDYCCNEPESAELFKFAKELTGKTAIDLTTVSSTIL